MLVSYPGESFVVSNCMFSYSVKSQAGLTRACIAVHSARGIVSISGESDRDGE